MVYETEHYLCDVYLFYHNIKVMKKQKQKKNKTNVPIAAFKI